jgi:hypothetical protein
MKHEWFHNLESLLDSSKQYLDNNTRPLCEGAWSREAPSYEVKSDLSTLTRFQYSQDRTQVCYS